MAGKGEVGREKMCAGIQVDVWACLQTNVELRVKRLDWIKGGMNGERWIQ